MFLAGAALIGPYAAWVFVLEREMFTRIPLVSVIVAFVLVLTVYYDGAREWLLGRKTRRVRIGFGVGLLVLGLMSIVMVPSVLLCVGLCEVLRRLPAMRRGLARWPGRRPQLVLTAAVVLALFPAMNAMYGFNGGLAHLTPVVLMHNPLYGINADGFRGPRISRARTPGVPRLLFLGDSTTFGWPYRYSIVYPDLVRAVLAERGYGPVEILNAGVPGRSIVQIHLALRGPLAFDPDMVFLMDGIHFEKSLGHLEESGRYGDRWDDHEFRPCFYPPGLVELLILGVVSNPLGGLFLPRADPAVLQARARENERVAAEHLGGLVEDLRARGIPLVILEYPSQHVSPVARTQQQAAAGREGVSWVSLLNLFPDEHGYSFGDGIHPDAAGHQRIAAAIVDALVARGWPPAVHTAGR